MMRHAGRRENRHHPVETGDESFQQVGEPVGVAEEQVAGCPGGPCTGRVGGDVLEVEPTVRLREPRPGEELDSHLDMSTSAFVRLVYGRLSPGRTPDSVVASEPAVLDRLRQIFPGF